MKINKITIENFRGIRKPLILDFKKGKKHSSIALYGRNGNGKSSIVDSWEWLYSNKIEHLAREGAAAKEFPHKGSGNEDCYIEIELSIGIDNSSVIKQQYDRSKITQPTITGDYDTFKKLVKHPCHLRYRDLQTFVYFKKAERYSYLAKYLGFETQLAIQDNLFTCRNKLKQKEAQFLRVFENSKNKISGLISIQNIENIEQDVIRFVNQVCKNHNVNPISKTNELKFIEKGLKTIIEKDPKTENLTQWRSFKNKINRFKKIVNIETAYDEAHNSFSELKKNEANISKLLILNLYNVSLDLINEGENICPLCSNDFNGNLKKHITTKHEELYSLKKEKEHFEDRRSNLKNKLRSSISALEQLSVNHIKDVGFKDFFQIIEKLKNQLLTLSKSLNKELSSMEIFPAFSESLKSNISYLNKEHEALKNTVSANIELIEKDETRQKLANDFEKLTQVILAFKNYSTSQASYNYIQKKGSEFQFVLDNYVNWVKLKFLK